MKTVEEATGLNMLNPFFLTLSHKFPTKVEIG